MIKKYPIGTKVKFIGSCKKCSGNTGKITQVYGETCQMTMPYSSCSGVTNGTIICRWDEIEILVVKGQQLLFDFYRTDYV